VSTTSAPGAVLTVVGIVLVVVGLLVAGSLMLIGLGIASLVVADVAQSVASRRA
jgi:sugar phosphate permease